MTHYAALDVSLNESALCILDADGNAVRESKVTSEPEAVVEALWNHRADIALIAAEVRVVGGPPIGRRPEDIGDVDGCRHGV